jgi:hypothetical protein
VGQDPGCVSGWSVIVVVLFVGDVFLFDRTSET